MSERSRRRLVVLQVLIISVVATLLGRLWYLQVMAGDTYKVAASENRVRELVTQPVRGLILDDRGRPLVQNRTMLVITVDRTELGRQPDDGAAVLERLSGVIGVPVPDIRDRLALCGTEGAKKPPICWNGSPFQPVPVAEGATNEMALTVMERREDFPGVTADVQSVREYPAVDGVNAAHILGYLGPVTEDEVALSSGTGNPLRDQDLIGRSGLEATYDEVLRGFPGVRQLSVDRFSNVTGTLGETPAQAGNYLVTSIDTKVQAATERALVEAINQARGVFDEDTGRNYIADSGAAIVLNAKTGHVVAMASYPTYDPNIWVGGISDADYAALQDEAAGVPSLSRAIAGEYAPASTWKAVTTAAAVKAGYSPNARYDCSSEFQVGNRAFRNYESNAYGPIDLKRTIQISCDTVYYRLAYELWLRDGGNSPPAAPGDAMINEALGWGFNKKTGIDLPGERDGRIVTRASKQESYDANKDTWCNRARDGYPEVPDPARRQLLHDIARENCADGYKYRAGDAVNFSIGQGDSVVTPLQLVQAYAALGNGGRIMKPQIGKAVVSPQGQLVQEIAPVQSGALPIDEGLRGFLVDALASVTTGGTAAGAFAGFPLAQIPVAGKTGTGEVANKQVTAWFVSFAPAYDPQYAVVVAIAQGGTGGRVAAPAVRKIYESLFGVVNGVPNPAAAAIPGVVPPTGLPEVKTDGTVTQPVDAPWPPG